MKKNYKNADLNKNHDDTEHSCNFILMGDLQLENQTNNENMPLPGFSAADSPEAVLKILLDELENL